MTGKGAIVVGIGYPEMTGFIWHARRGADLTTPSKHRLPSLRPGDTGEAEDFLNVVYTQIMPLVEQQCFPTIENTRWRKALFGHSYGGLFALFSLFTQTSLFSTYVSASPSISWKGSCIQHEQWKKFLEQETPADSKRSLLITYGDLEQYPRQKLGESDENFERRKDTALHQETEDKAIQMAEILEKSKKFDIVKLIKFLDEDHENAAVCGLQRGLRLFIEGEC